MVQKGSRKGEKGTYKRRTQEAEYIKIIEELFIWLWDVSWKMMETQMAEFTVAEGNLTRLSL